jgi:hypothetical protein
LPHLSCSIIYYNIDKRNVKTISQFLVAVFQPDKIHEYCYAPTLKTGVFNAVQCHVKGTATLTALATSPVLCVELPAGDLLLGPCRAWYWLHSSNREAQNVWGRDEGERQVVLGLIRHHAINKYSSKYLQALMCVSCSGHLTPRKQPTTATVYNGGGEDPTAVWTPLTGTDPHPRVFVP